MTLENAKIGIIYKVKSMDLEVAIKRRLEALGITRNTAVKVINRNNSGSIILMVRGSRLALGRKIAESIQMEGVK